MISSVNINFIGSDDFQQELVFEGFVPPIPNVGEMVEFFDEDHLPKRFTVVDRKFVFFKDDNRQDCVDIDIYVEPVKDDHRCKI